VTLAALIAGNAATLRSRSGAHSLDALDSQTPILAQGMLGASIV
jgi:hypothetical protein